MNNFVNKTNRYFADSDAELISAYPEPMEEQDAEVFMDTLQTVERCKHYDEEETAEIILTPGTDTYRGLMNHIAECAECFQTYSLIRGELSETEAYLQQTIIREPEKKSYSFIRYGMYSSVAAVLLIGALFLLSTFSVPLHQKLGDTGSEEISVSVRGGSGENFQQGVLALDEKNYSVAIEQFSKELLSGSLSEPAFYTHYLLGLSHLFSARNTMLGLFPSYNQAALEKAIVELNRAVTNNRSGQYQNVTLDAFYYLGKAHLLLNRTTEARSYLQIVVLSRGSKMAEADRMLNELK